MNLPSAEFVLSSPAQYIVSADRDLQARVALFIKQRQLHRGADLTILSHRGVITLLGLVPTFHQRQLLRSLVSRVAGVVLVQDELEVATQAVGKSSVVAGQDIATGQGATALLQAAC